MGNCVDCTCKNELLYHSYWEKYKPIWEMDKEAYIRRYSKANRSLKNYNDDVTKYKDQQAEIQQENMTHMINFVQLDCILLKGDLMAHCQQWQQKLLGLLNQNARHGLDYLHDLFAENTSTLRTAPLDLEELSAKLRTLDELRRNSPAIEAKIPPIDEMSLKTGSFSLKLAGRSKTGTLLWLSLTSRLPSMRQLSFRGFALLGKSSLIRLMSRSML